jgi:hypothetical protein
LGSSVAVAVAPVALQGLPGYVEVEPFPVDGWLPRTPASVHLLRRAR